MSDSKYLYVNATENFLKFHGLDDLKSGDSVLLAHRDKDNWVEFFYSKPNRFGKWQINKFQTGYAPTLAFKTW